MKFVWLLFVVILVTAWAVPTTTYHHETETETEPEAEPEPEPTIEPEPTYKHKEVHEPGHITDKHMSEVDDVKEKREASNFDLEGETVPKTGDEAADEDKAGLEKREARSAGGKHNQPKFNGHKKSIYKSIKHHKPSKKN